MEGSPLSEDVNFQDVIKLHFTYFSNMLRKNLADSAAIDSRFRNYQSRTMQQCGVMKMTGLSPIPETSGGMIPFDMFGAMGTMNGTPPLQTSSGMGTTGMGIAPPPSPYSWGLSATHQERAIRTSLFSVTNFRSACGNSVGGFSATV